MKAELSLENIGSHRGVRKYLINSGKITIFSGPNSSGKSTIIKSIAAVLSSPIKSNNLVIEANKFGIIPREDKESPIVNIFEETAKINLKYGNLNYEAILLKDGTIKTNREGNENFLYSCMLVKNSKIQEYLSSGDDNFQWIVSEMSLANKYEQLKDNIDSYTRLNDLAINSLDEIKKKIGKYIEENKELESKNDKIKKDLKRNLEEKGQIDASKFPGLKNLLEEAKKIENDISIAKKQKNSLDVDVENTKVKLEKFGSKLSNLNTEISEKQNTIKQIDNEISRRKSLDEQKILAKINENKDKLPDLASEHTRNKVFLDLNNTLLNSRLESDVCPLCKSKITITKQNLLDEINQLKKNIDTVIKKKNAIRIEIDKGNNKIKDIRGISNLEADKAKVTKAINEKSRDKGSYKKKQEEIQTDLTRIQTSIDAVEETIKKLHNKLASNKKNRDKYDILKPFEEKEEKIRSEIQKNESKILANNELIKEKSQISIFDIDIPIEKSEILKLLSSELEIIDTYLIEKINYQRLGAGNEFNSTIEQVIKELKLKDFEKIYINLEDYRLVVVRKGGKMQPLGALGGAERGIIGGILQISCKQSYLKDIPFFVGDDIILEFDPEMSKVFIEYLKKIAVEEDLFIIITQLSETGGLEQLEV